MFVVSLDHAGVVVDGCLSDLTNFGLLLISHPPCNGSESGEFVKECCSHYCFHTDVSVGTAGLLPLLSSPTVLYVVFK